MNPTTRTHDRSSYVESITTPVSKVAAQLLEVLGAKLAALVVGLSDPKAIAAYAKGAREPQAETDTKLRNAHQVVVRLLKGNIPREAIQAWFVGMNPDLDDQAPAKIILENPKLVLDAARAFAEEV